MLNAIAKAYNRRPKPDSKTQQAKSKQPKPHALVCSMCGKGDGTLYKVDGKRYCKNCCPRNEDETV